jgi:hypothetical protein
VSDALNEKTLTKGALWHNLSRHGPRPAKDAHFPCFRFAARYNRFHPFLLRKPRAFKPASGEETMSSSERRIDTRVNVCVPLRFRVLNNPGSTEQTAHSENISQRGLYFLTNVPLKIGTPVEISLRMPQELAGRVASDVKCVARVVHVRESSAPGGLSGIGLRIERYEAKASARERWAS